MGMQTMTGQKVTWAAQELAHQWGTFRPRAAIVLGSGFGGVAGALKTLGSIEYTSIVGFPRSTVVGHAGKLLYGYWNDVSVVCLQGRAHLYEGRTAEEVVLPIRSLIHLGVDTVILTNAAGGIRSDLAVGSLMLVRDHINLTGHNPLVGANEPSFGIRFPDMSKAYTPELRQAAHESAREGKMDIHEGVYAGVMGPSYETPAEIGMLRSMGADAVGMSTVLEVIAATHMGAQVLAVSGITNAAAGLGDGPLHHQEVEDVAKAAQERMTRLIEGVLKRLASA